MPARRYSGKRVCGHHKHRFSCRRTDYERLVSQSLSALSYPNFRMQPINSGAQLLEPDLLNFIGGHMKSNANAQIIGAVLAGLGMLFLGRYVQNVIHQNGKGHARKLAKHAVQSWEGEGGSVSEPLPRLPAH